MTVFLGTLWSSIKQIEVPYVFDWENEIALHTMQENRASSCSEGEFSWVFSSSSTNLGYVLQVRRGCPFETGVCSAKSGHLGRYDGHLRNVHFAWQDNKDASGGHAGDQASFSSFTVILGFL